MGEIFSGGLTNPGSMLTSPQGQTFIGSPAQVLSKANQSIGGLPDVISRQIMPSSGQDLPTIGRPDLQTAARAGALPGSANVFSPGLNKAGKLTTLLMSGLQGALAGRAASEQAVVQSGGRRSGGAGMGFQAALAQPMQRAQMAAETQLAQAGTQPIQTPYGQMPAALASKILTPYLGYQGKVQSAQIGGQAKESAAQTQAGATLGAAEINKRFQVVPNVGLYDTQAGGLVPGTAQGITITPEIAKDLEIPPEYIGKPMSLQQLAGLQRSKAFQEIPVMGAQGPAIVNRKTKETTSLGLGNPGVAVQMARPYDITDPETGITSPITTGQAIRAGQQGQPVISAKSNLQKNAFTPKARFDDINRAVGFTKNSLEALDQNSEQRALIGKSLAETEHQPGMIGTVINSKLYSGMTPQSRDFVIGISSLREQIMGANQMLTGTSGTSDSRVQAIWNTLPSGSDPDSKFASRRMEQVDGMIRNLKEAFPQVPAIEKQQKSTKPSASTKGGGGTGITIERDSNGRIIGIK